MKAVDYFRLWFTEAFTHSFGTADYVASAIGIFGPSLIRMFGQDESAANSSLIGQIVFGVFTSCFVVRLVCAPYWLHKEHDAEWQERIDAESAKSAALAAENAQLRDIPSLSIDYDPKIIGFLGGKVKAFVKTDTNGRTVHNVSIALIEFVSVPGDQPLHFEQFRFPLNDDPEFSLPIRAGEIMPVPIIEFGRGGNVRTLAGPFHHSSWYGNANGKMYRITIQATGEDAKPAWATFVFGFNAKGYFLRRLKRTTPPRPHETTGAHPVA